MNRPNIPFIVAVWLAIPIAWIFGYVLLPSIGGGWLSSTLTAMLVSAGILAIERLIARSTRHRQPTHSPAAYAGALSRDDDPLVAVVFGPHAAQAFERNSTGCRHDGGAVWWCAETPEKFSEILTRIRATRGRLPDFAWLPLVCDVADESTARMRFAEWRHAVKTMRFPEGWALPCHIGIHVRLCVEAALERPVVWPGGAEVEVGLPLPSRVRMSTFRDDTLARLGALSSDDGTLAVAAMTWLDDVALLAAAGDLANAGLLSCGGGYLSIEHLASTTSGAWSRSLTRLTGLALPNGATGRVSQRARSVAPMLPLPAVLDAPGRPASRLADPSSCVRSQLVPHLAWASCAGLVLAMSVSAVNNHRQINALSERLYAQQHTPRDQVAARTRATARLRADLALAERYAKVGPPLALGWGFYPGAMVVDTLKQALASDPGPIRSVRIEGRALFASGQARLPRDIDETKLRAALQLIDANPEFRVLIEAHADSQGSAPANVALSEARARTIRDWLVVKGGLPPNRFVLQGWGDTRPIAANDTAGGRAANRRVEISLIEGAPNSGSAPDLAADHNG